VPRPGGIRELHWHQSAEWAYMTNGQCRITGLDKDGRACVQDVSEGDRGFFPAGQPHSLQGIGPHGCEFRIVFDDGKGIRIQHAAGDRLARTRSRLADAHAARGELGDQAGRER
jgi:oxalate decarboxylase/phosphoglucose isomerase-like protein (cupin superfamily)